MLIPSLALLKKHWNHLKILRDDGLSYGDYVERLTYLLFLMMAAFECRLSVIDELETLATANLPRTTHLRQSIPQQAFAGNLSKQI